MKRRVTLSILSFISIFSINSWASVLCASGPTNTVNALTLTVIYTCTIPANTISSGQTLRITTDIYEANGGNTDLYINGKDITGEGMPTGLPANHYWNFLFFNTGSTTRIANGLLPTYNSSVPQLKTTAWSSTLTGLNWGTAQTLQMEASAASSAQGRVFLVEVVN